MFSKFRQLNGLIINTARRSSSIYSALNSSYSYAPNTSNKNRTVSLLKPASSYRQAASSPSTFQVHMTSNQIYIDVHGARAKLLFDLHDQVMTITHTKVPKELSGHGLGKILAKSALDFAFLNGYFLRIKCAFVKHYIEKYEPQYAKYMI